MTLSQRVRPLPICLIYCERGGGRDLLVMEGFDHFKKSWLYRPLGGGPEFDERGRETLRREVFEEIRQHLTGVWFLGVLENLFTYAGTPGHELMMGYEGHLADEAVYKLNSLSAREDDGSSFTARWLPLTDFQNFRRRLVPEGLSNYLTVSNAMTE